MRRRTRTTRALVAGIALAGALSGAYTTPASATTAAAGSATFEGTAFLPKFPCPPPPPFGTGPCIGSFTGQWAGHVAGVSGTSPFDVTWSTVPVSGSASPAVVVSALTYAEWQCAAETETVLGIAQGSGTATVAPGQLQGKWQVVAEPFARDVVGVSLAFTFQWTRLGNTAALVFPSAVLQLNVSGLGWRTVISSALQGGVATFAPTSSSGGGVPSCTNPLTNVTGTIAGTVPLAGAA